MISKYNVKGFPSLLILNEEGFPLNKVGMSFRDSIESALGKMTAGLKKGTADKKAIDKVLDDASAVLDNSGSSDSDKLAAANTLLDKTSQYSVFYVNEIEAVKSFDKSNTYQILEKILLTDLANLNWWNQPSSFDEHSNQIDTLLALSNVTDTTKKTCIVYQAIILKFQGDKDKAVETINSAEGLDTFLGRPFDLDWWTGWLQK